MAKDPQGTRKSFTGVTFERKPRKTVMWVDDFARRLITASGIGSIIAVSLVGLFLVWVVLPLFTQTDLKEAGPLRPASTALEAGPAVFQSLDDYGSLVWSLHENGQIQVRDLESGRTLDRIDIRPGQEPTAWAQAAQGDRLVFGYEDGSITTCSTKFDISYLPPDDWTAAMEALEAGQRLIHGKGVVEMTNENQIRLATLAIEVNDPVSLGEAAITRLSVTNTPRGMVLVALDAAGNVHDRSLTWRKNLLTGKLRTSVAGDTRTARELGLDVDDLPNHVALNDAGDMALMFQKGGQVRMFRRNDDGEFAPTYDFNAFEWTEEKDREVTSVGFLAGQVSVVIGDNKGGVWVWLPVRRDGHDTPIMTPVHDLTHHLAPVTALAPSGRSRTLAIGYADGTVDLVHVTAGRFLGEADLPRGPVTTLAIAPREDLVVAASPAGFGTWELDAPHPDISFGALFQKVWYEGYDEPSFVWQSSSASDTFEHKLSLIPLIFGTLKATFYSMLFGLPLALLAALYTSEFLDKGTRAKVKPVIEIMASLPSVVLGFLAALVVAPIIEKVIPQTLAIMFLGPFFVLIGAHLWQMLPRTVAPRLEHYRPVAVLVVMVIGALLSYGMGPGLESIIFHGNIRAWLDGRIGGGTPGWFLLLLPAAALLVGWLNINFGEGIIRRRGPGWGSVRLALLDMGRFLVGAAATVGIAWFLGWLLASSGWDPRGSVVSTYVQRNALIVGFAMGFAIIPIIYSIAEDALSAVPDHLRAASLGAGATTWQTAIKVVVPPAVSGLFSAAMIGLGRAVGETMIVLMAAGNTPIMDWNIFNGFRTLSANLAVELPEAVQNSTHYRTLFLAALVLFLMTFVLNTVAEGVRLHFRRKSSQL